MNKFESKLYMIIKFIVIVGALNWGLVGAFNFNIIEYIADLIGDKKISKIIYVAIGICALLVVSQRKTYLPFLGEAVLPHTSFPEHKFQEDYNLTIKVTEPNAEKIIYWASLPGDSSNNYPEEAYGDYSNSGVANINEQGVATLYIKCPQQYKVPLFKGLLKKGKKLVKHVHYRIAYKNGMVSEIKTIPVDC